MKIVLDDLSGQEIAALLNEHMEEMHSISPRESCHVLDLDGLRSTNVSFWTVWENESLAGCGALKELDAVTGEIKSMRTAVPHRGKGVATLLLRHIIEVSQRRGYRAVYLETGSMAEFEPARSLYLKHGFTLCPPFADYVEDPNSVFMTLKI